MLAIINFIIDMLLIIYLLWHTRYYIKDEAYIVTIITTLVSFSLTCLLIYETSKSIY